MLLFSLYFSSLNLKYLKLAKMELARFTMKLFILLYIKHLYVNNVYFQDIESFYGICHHQLGILQIYILYLCPNCLLQYSTALIIKIKWPGHSHAYDIVQTNIIKHTYILTATYKTLEHTQLMLPPPPPPRVAPENNPGSDLEN